jgi:uncharacterized membrane protein
VGVVYDPALEERLHENPDHWSGPIYFCRADRRLWVPKRYGLGWTINVGHPSGGWTLCGLFLTIILLQAAIVVIVGVVRRDHCNC